MATTTTTTCDKCKIPIGDLDPMVTLSVGVAYRTGSVAQLQGQPQPYSGASNMHPACAAPLLAEISALGIAPAPVA